MKVFPTLQEAQAAQDKGEVFSLIYCRDDSHWEAYEPGDTIPPEATGDQPQ